MNSDLNRNSSPFIWILKKNSVKGVYLMIYKNVLLYSKENQVEIDFLEQMLSVLVPEMVIGRRIM